MEYVTMAALVVGVSAVWFVTSPKKVEVKQPEPITSTQIPVVYESVRLDKNTLCDRECKKLKYQMGAWGVQACKCWTEY